MNAKEMIQAVAEGKGLEDVLAEADFGDTDFNDPSSRDKVVGIIGGFLAMRDIVQAMMEMIARDTKGPAAQAWIDSGQSKHSIKIAQGAARLNGAITDLEAGVRRHWLPADILDQARGGWLGTMKNVIGRLR